MILIDWGGSMKCPNCKSTSVTVLNVKTIKDPNGNIITQARIQCNECFKLSTIEVL